MKELITLLFCLVWFTLGFLLMYKDLIRHSYKMIKAEVADAVGSDKQRIDSLINTFSSLMDEMQAENGTIAELDLQKCQLEYLVNEQENKLKELKEYNLSMSDVNEELKRDNEDLADKAAKLRDETVDVLSVISDMKSQIDSLDRIKTGLEIAVNNIAAEEIPFLSRAISCLGITPSIVEKLERYGIVYVGDLIHLSEDYIMDIWGIGPVNMGKITGKMKENDVWFGMDVIRVGDRWYQRKKNYLLTNGED